MTPLVVIALAFGVVLLVLVIGDTYGED